VIDAELVEGVTVEYYPVKCQGPAPFIRGMRGVEEIYNSLTAHISR
jgi:hypothetical protein